MMHRTSAAGNRNGVDYPNIDVLLSNDHQRVTDESDQKAMDAERWYFLIRKMIDLSERADLMTIIVDSMKLSLDRLCTRVEDMEAMMTSVMNMQLSIAKLQLDIEMLQEGLLVTPENIVNADDLHQIRADARETLRLVVEDNERAAKAAEGPDRKEATHLNGNAHRVLPTNHALTQNALRTRFTIPRVPSTYIGHPEPTNAMNGSGDTVDNVVVAPKTKLISFQERKEYYHDAKFLQSEVSLASSNEPVEKDDEGDHHDDNVNPLLNDMEKPPLYVHLPHKPECTDLPPSLQDPLVDQHMDQRPNQTPGPDKKLQNNNKDPEGEVESSCIVDCLYYTIQCCDCSIM